MQSVSQQGLRATYRKVSDRLDAYTPLGYSLCGEVVEVGAGVEELAVGQRVACAGNSYALHAEYNWVPRNLCVPAARRGRLRARRLHHRGRHRHAGLPAVGGAARGDRLRHRPRPGRAAARAAPAGRRGQRGRPRPVDRAVPAGRAERGGRLPPTRPGQPRPGAGGARRPHRRRRRRPRLPHRRRRHQPAGRARRRAGPGPGPGRRHRQVPPGPALDRVLRQGARGPLLALVRPRPLRPDLRGGRGRLPDRLRPLDRAAQHGLLPGPGGRGSARPGPARLRGAAVRRRGRRLRADPARRAGRRRHAVPLLGQRVAAAPAGHRRASPIDRPAGRSPSRWSGSV